MSNQENGNVPAPAVAATRRSRGGNFNFDEDRFLNDSYEEVLPISANERDEARRIYGELWTLYTRGELTTRTAESLYARFTRLKNHPMGTGDPECPENVKRAKRIYRDIMAKAGGHNGGEEHEEALAIEDVPAPNEEAENEGNEEAEGGGNEAAVLAEALADDHPAILQNRRRRNHRDMSPFQDALLEEMRARARDREAMFQRMEAQDARDRQALETQSKSVEVQLELLKVQQMQMSMQLEALKRDREEKKDEESPMKKRKYTEKQKKFFKEHGLDDSDDEE